MLYLYLAMTGDVVQVPDGDAVVDEGGSEIKVVDAHGRVLLTFPRHAVSLFSRTPLQPNCYTR